MNRSPADASRFTDPPAAAAGEEVNVRIRGDKLLELLRERHVTAADFTCLDGEAKHCLWHLLLCACDPDG